MLTRKWITKIRLSSHNLCIETGRFYGISKNSRMYIMCDINVVEVESEFLLFYNVQIIVIYVGRNIIRLSFNL